MTITESRLALIFSAVALLGTLAQVVLMYRSNQINEEQLIIVGKGSDKPRDRTRPPICSGDQVLIPHVWRADLFNGSAQPVTVREFTVVTLKPQPATSFAVGPDGPLDQHTPFVIEAKNVKTFYVTSPVIASPEFAQWFRENGGCAGKPIWPSDSGRSRFDESGWNNNTPVQAVVLTTTGTGEKFNRIVDWR